MTTDAKEWEGLERKMRDASNAHFLHIKEDTSLVPDHALYPDSVFYENNTVTADILPLTFGLVPKARIKEIARSTVATIITTNKGYINTGVIGT